MSPSPRATERQVASLLGGELVQSIWVRRLGRISFLGTLDHHPRSRKRSNRGVHSLCVAALGIRTAAELELSTELTRTFVAACLLHDIGHFPLSHAAEAAFRDRLGVGHHEVSEWIILGTGEIPRHRSLRGTLEQVGVSPGAVWAIIEGGAEDSILRDLGGLLQGTINLDTLDGIVRVARDFRLRRPILPENVFARRDDTIVIRAAAIPGMDAFWRLKDRVYDSVINLPSNILAEARLCELVHERLPDISVFDRFEEFDDDALARRLGGSGVAVDPGELVLDGEDGDYEFRTAAGWGQVMRRTRKRYHVASSGEETVHEDLPMSAWRERYLHRKESAFLVSRRTQLDLPGLESRGASAQVLQSTTLATEGPQI